MDKHDWTTEAEALAFLREKDWLICRDGDMHNPPNISDRERSAALYLCHEWDYEWA